MAIQCVPDKMQEKYMAIEASLKHKKLFSENYLYFVTKRLKNDYLEGNHFNFVELCNMRAYW